MRIRIFDLLYFAVAWLEIIPLVGSMYRVALAVAEYKKGCARCGKNSAFSLEQRRYCSPCHVAMIHRVTNGRISLTRF